MFQAFSHIVLISIIYKTRSKQSIIRLCVFFQWSFSSPLHAFCQIVLDQMPNPNSEFAKYGNILHFSIPMPIPTPRSAAHDLPFFLVVHYLVHIIRYFT